MDLAVTVANVSKSYPRHHGALSEVSISVRRGEIFGLLGPNGSGKTTLQKIICGLLTPDTGKVTVVGAAYVFDGERSFYWRLTGRQNLEFFAALSGCDQAGVRPKIASLARRLGVEAHLDKQFAAFSAGNRQKLSLIRALLTEPEVLVLDEPTRSLDPGVTQEVHNLMRELVRRDGKTVIWATHNLPEAEAVCDRAALLSSGRMLAEAPAAGLGNTYFRLMPMEEQVLQRG